MKCNTVLFLPLFIILLSSCKKDFLEVVDKTILLKQGYVVDLTTTEHYLNGIYSQIASYFANGRNLMYPELIADDVKPFGAGLDWFGDIYSWNQSTSNPTGVNFYGHWFNNYRIIKGCSFVIEKSNLYKGQNPLKAANLKGQALAIRAWMHFSLINMFAQSYNYSIDASHTGIPYVLTSDVQEAVKRLTVAKVYEFIIADLNEALEYLSPTVASKQYMNSQAAKALLARVYLFKGDYLAAKNISTQISKDVPIMIVNYPQKLYSTNETEALFQLPPGNSNNYYTTYMGYYSTRFIHYLATDDIVQLYQVYPSDKRNGWITFVSGKGWTITKFPKGTADYPRPEGDHYQTFFRSTEMVLTAAESFAELNNEDSARYFINQIRNRAGVPELTTSVVGSALKDSIRFERRKEMAFDGLRMYDLQRWKIGVKRMDALSSDAQSLPYPNNKAIAPIPLEDVQVAGLPQNQEY